MLKSSSKEFRYFLLAVFAIVLIWSFIKPNSLLTWFLESTPILVGFVILLVTYKYLRLTSLTYMIITISSILVLIGGHYTYGDEPTFNLIKENFHLSRNHYDRFGHLFFGVTAAILIREILLRKTVLKKGKLLTLIVLCISLSISALYEILEWMVGIFTGKSARYFLGMQGDIWDTQIDMAIFLLGAILSLLLLNKIHDRYIKRVN